MTLDPADLKLRIEEAFAGMTYPGDEHIASWDEPCYSGDHERIEMMLKGLHWRDVSFEILDNLRVGLTFMSPEGFRFYLPAYMMISVMDYYRADVIPAIVISHITPLYASDIDQSAEEIASYPRVGPFSSFDWERDSERYRERMTDYHRSGEAERRFLERVSGLNEAQCKIIRQFLEYMRDAHSADFSQEAGTALERYWHRF
jgi:hypothetical protein